MLHPFLFNKYDYLLNLGGFALVDVDCDCLLAFSCALVRSEKILLILLM